MGRLATGVREAEERLAAIARALQSVYDEEVREATQARDAAARSLVRAEAMEEASRALGNPDVTARLTDVIAQLRAAHTSSVARLEELAGIEKTISLRLADEVPPPAPMLPAAAPPAPAPAAPAASPSSSLSVPALSATMPPVSVAAAEGSREDTLAASMRNLLGRIDEVERLVPKWPRDLATVTVQEHVALVRVLMGKLTAAGRPTEDLATALGRLNTLAGTMLLAGVAGLTSDTGADWSKLAAETRAKRLALTDARKRTLSRPG